MNKRKHKICWISKIPGEVLKEKTKKLTSLYRSEIYMRYFKDK